MRRWCAPARARPPAPALRRAPARAAPARTRRAHPPTRARPLVLQYEEMSKEEKAADATLMTCIAEMELLTKQMEGISEQTIAEILEQEPEMRKEIEEELENNVWAP